MLNGIFGLFLEATGQTLLMVVCSTLIAVIVGIPLGVLMRATDRGYFWSRPLLNRIISWIVNAIRSIPFIILMVAIIPFTRWVVGSSIGTLAAIVPLAVSAIPFLARIVESALNEVQSGLLEAAEAMGATSIQIIRFVLLAEAMPSIIRGITLTTIALVGYSAMAGAVGGGGLGDLAIRYGYDRFEMGVMLATIVVLIVLVQLLQAGGDWLARRLAHQ
jgi:D-methionine transport system permease protein